MSLFVEVVLALLQAIWLWLVAIYKAVVPVTYQKKKNIEGQIVLITGAGSGLGRLMSLRFAMLHCKVVLWDIDQKSNDETAQLVTNLGGEASTYQVDLSKREEIYQAAEKVKSEVGDVDILVNNAGIVTGKKFLDCPDSLIEKTMAVNCNAHFWTVKSFLPAMMAHNRGHIVSIASGAGWFGVSELCDYCASKFAAVGFDESLRQELNKQGKTGVHTTVVCPFYISTGMFEGVKSRFPYLLPILKPEEVVDRIMNAVLTNQEMLMVPQILYHLLIMKGIFPIKMMQVLGNLFGVNNSMDEFVGRAKSR